MRRLACAVGFLVAVWMAVAPAAAEPTRLSYQVWWGGLLAAEMALTVDDGPSRYRTEVRIETRGAISRLFQLHFDATAEGEDPLEAPPVPRQYAMDYRSATGRRIVLVEFDPVTGTAAKTRDDEYEHGAPKADDGDDPPPIAAPLRTGVIDPLTMLLTLGQLAARRDGFVLPVFDGKRRMDFLGQVTARKPDQIQVRLTLKPIAGFKPRHQRLWQDAVLDITLDTMTRLPVRIVNDTLFAQTLVRLTGRCSPAPSCAVAQRGSPEKGAGAAAPRSTRTP